MDTGWRGRIARTRAPSRLGAVVALAAALVWPAPASLGASLETTVKASFLYKFGPFVQWPASALPASGAAFQVCVLGEDPFGQTLDDAVRGQTIGGRPIVVRRLSAINGDQGCQVLYIGRSRAQSPTQALALLKGSPVLTVTDQASGTSGGIIHLMIKDGRVRFSIDNAAARACGLVLSSKLLALAVPAQGGGG